MHIYVVTFCQNSRLSHCVVRLLSSNACHGCNFFDMCAKESSIACATWQSVWSAFNSLQQYALVCSKLSACNERRYYK